LAFASARLTGRLPCADSHVHQRHPAPSSNSCCYQMYVNTRRNDKNFWISRSMNPNACILKDTSKVPTFIHAPLDWGGSSSQASISIRLLFQTLATIKCT
jgi:hypothetical protein